VRSEKPKNVGDLVWPVGLAVAVYVALTELDFENQVLIAAAAVCAVFALRRPARLAAGLAALFLAGTLGVAAAGTPVIDRERNFFGPRTIEQGGDVRSLVHGTTLHGNQLLGEGLPQPTTYYHPASPIGQLVTGGPRGLTRRTAVIGLGTGTMAAYSQPGDRWTFYEIDPEIVRVARDPRYFTYLQDAPGAIDIVLGDARLSLQDARDGTFSLIVADAFSSDAIPTHLITREALALYFRKLAPDGALAFHISNRYVDLETVLGNLAREAGLTCFLGNLDAPLAEGIQEANASQWAALARTREDLGQIAGDGRWRRCHTGPDSHTWTDDYSNIIGLLR
jgi:hypothetical protein